MIISVKAARVNKSLTQEQVAKAVGLSLNGYKRKESGQRRFYADELVRLSELLDVPLLNFFEAGCHNKTQQGA